MQRYHSRPDGFSLVEILIGLAIGMLTVIVMLQAMSVAESYRRDSTTGGDAQSNGAVAMYSLQRDMRLAGYGIVTNETDGVTALCSTGTTTANNSERTLNGITADITFSAGLLPFAPFVINPGSVPAGDPGSDVIEVIYSGSFGMVGSGVSVTQASATAYNAVGNRAGFRHGDLVLIAGMSGGLPTCSMVEVTHLPLYLGCGEPTSSNPTDASHIVYDTAAYPSIYLDPVGCSRNVSPVWNGGAAIAYASARAYNLGAAGHTQTNPPIPSGLVAKLFTVRNGRLTSCDILARDCTAAASACTTATPTACNDAVWVPIADDVIAIKALYGMDDGATGVVDDGVVDSWTSTTPATFAGWGRLLSARIYIVARGKQFSKNVVTANNLLPWNDGASNLDLAQTASGTDWKHYRYRTFETKVPFRNMIWK